MIRSKTAALFAAAAELGPILSKNDEEKITALRNYGMALGNAFQLIDDALDYGGSAANLGKNVGDDFREGKITLPVILANERGSDEDKAFWKRVMEDRKFDESDLAHAMELLKSTSALDDTLAQARQHGADAIAALDIFEDSPHKSALIDAVEFCISRGY